jgi:hypothetical protein
MKRRCRLPGMVVLLSLALVAAGCGDDDSQSVGAGGPTPTATPAGPVLGGVQCDPTSDTCVHTHTQLFAIAHAFVDPANTVYYRVTVPAAPTGTDWGDGTNGFFYQAVVNGGTPSAYVPFNGMAVGDDNRPMLPQFSFIVVANVASGETNATLEIDLCATDYLGGTATVPPCTKPLWADKYTGLPVPAMGLGPADHLFSVTPSVLFAGETGTSLTVPNNGVYPGVLEVCPTLNGSTCAVAGDLSDSQLQWFYDHLVFFGLDGKPYTNNVFDDSSTQHRSMGVLSLVEAAYPISATTYRTRYGSTTPVTARDLPVKQFFFYTTNGTASTGITVGVQYLYDAATCNGNLNGVGCGSSTTGEVDISPAASVSPEGGLNGNVEAYPANQNDTAGTVETRSLVFERDPNATCSDTVNPLAVNPSGAAADAGDLQPNRPNYVIDDKQNASTLWAKRFPPALYYVLPAGFGNCDPNQEPFCHLTTNYVAYIPQYTSGNNGGVLNGGSTDETFVDGLTLADQYALPGISSSNRNSLIWFDNCGYGYVYQECRGTVSCTNSLGTRKTLPTPPSGLETYTYTVTNSRPGAVVFGKECCASWYQQQQQPDQTTVMIPPVQIHDGFGVFVSSKQSVTYQTLFGDEAIVAYDATTGNRLHKLRLNTQARSAVYGCGDASCDASPAAAGCPAAAVTGSSPNFTVQLTDAGAAALACAPVGPCPFGMTPGDSGAYTTCTTTASSFLLGIPEWNAESLVGVSSVQLRAWGGKGSPGDYNQPSQAGFALTVSTPEDLVNDLYAYVGVGPSGKIGGGSSTILTNKAISSFLESDMATFESPNLQADVILIAGGGGGAICIYGALGRECSEGQFRGGVGGVAISNDANSPGPDVSAPGGDAMDQATTSYGGGGGNKDGRGSGGTAGNGSTGTGNSGVGGWGGDCGGGFGWQLGSLIGPSSWSPGMGQSNSCGVAYTGAGGGGFGGGGKGGGNGDGGGGGSWALGNTAHDPYGPTLSAAPTSPGGSSGAVQFAYIPGPGTKVVVTRAQLTTPAHPQPTDCLGTAVAGTILTNQNYSLVWGSNGYLTLNNALGNPIWRSGNTTPGSQVCFQGDGNLVIYGSSGALWASDTADAEHGGSGSLWMRLDSSCNLVLVNASQTTLFQTNTSCTSPPLS